MLHKNQESWLQDSELKQIMYSLLKAAEMPNNNVLLRHIKEASDYSTQILNEYGTTDKAIGDATAEIMMTTLGKIPNEMYYLEDTVGTSQVLNHRTDHSRVLTETTHAIVLATEANKSNETGYTNHSPLLLTLLIALLIILLLCCITACLVAKSRRRSTFFGKNDIECEPGCSGINQPLLGVGKISDASSKTSISSIKN